MGKTFRDLGEGKKFIRILEQNGDDGESKILMVNTWKRTRIIAILAHYTEANLSFRCSMFCFQRFQKLSFNHV